MGYFSNGSEGMDYEEKFCRRCIHDEDENCPVLGLHKEWNYEQHTQGYKKVVLSHFIPHSSKGGWNLACKMYIPNGEGVAQLRAMHDAKFVDAEGPGKL